MGFPISKDCPLPRPNWSWIAPDGTTFPLDVAYNESHSRWVSENLKGTDEYYESSDGSPDLDSLFTSGWIKRSGETFQTSPDHVLKAKGYIDKHEAKGKYFTIVSRMEDGDYWGIGTIPGTDIEACGGWTKIKGI